MTDSFIVSCDNCKCQVIIYNVSLYRSRASTLHEPLYSYGYRCTSCGAAVEVDGDTGQSIPLAMRQKAEEEAEAYDVKNKIDQQRRKVKFSAGKALLKNSSLQLPVKQPDSSWLIYELPNASSIFYDTKSNTYQLRSSNTKDLMFSDIMMLIEYLDKKGS